MIYIGCHVMHAPSIVRVSALTVIVRAGASGRAIPGGPGSLPVGIGSEVGGVQVDWPGAGAIGDEDGEECSKCKNVGVGGNHLVPG